MTCRASRQACGSPAHVRRLRQQRLGHLHSRHRFGRRLGDHRHLHRRRTDPDSWHRLLRRQHLSARVRPGAHRGGGRWVDCAARRARCSGPAPRAARSSLHHTVARLPELQPVRAHGSGSDPQWRHHVRSRDRRRRTRLRYVRNPWRHLVSATMAVTSTVTIRPSRHGSKRTSTMPTTTRARLRSRGGRSTQLTVTPSFYYQKTESNGRPQYWERQSDVDEQDFRTGIYNKEPSSDKFSLPAVKIEYDLGGIDLISNTSYFDRDRTQVLDYATFLSTLRSGSPFGTYGNKDPTNACGPADRRAEETSCRKCVCSRRPRTSGSTGAPVCSSPHTKQEMTNLSASGRIPGVLSSGFPPVSRPLQPVRFHHRHRQAVRRVRQPRFQGDLESHDDRGRCASRVTSSISTRPRDGPTNSGKRTLRYRRAVEHLVHSEAFRHLPSRYRQHGLRHDCERLSPRRCAGTGGSEFLRVGSRHTRPVGRADATTIRTRCGATSSAARTASPMARCCSTRTSTT